MARSATSLISKSIPNLLGGISQQPDALRFDNQCGLQDNGLPSILDGLIKRPPTEHIAQILGDQDSPEPTAIASAEEYFTHIINLNNDDQYIVLIQANHEVSSTTNNTITIRKLSDGSEVTVHAGSPLLDYLKMSSSAYKAETSLRAISIADYTFLINRSKKVYFTEDTDDVRDPEALFYIKTGDYGTEYTATIKIGQDTYKTVVTTPGGNQVKEFWAPGEGPHAQGGSLGGLLKANSFDARDAIDTSNIAKAFMTGEALGFNSYLHPTNATNGQGVTDGGTIIESTTTGSDPAETMPTPEHVWKADDDKDMLGFRVGADSTIMDYVNDSNEGGEPRFHEVFKLGDRIYFTGSEEAANNFRIFEIGAITPSSGGGEQTIHLTEQNVLTDADNTGAAHTDNTGKDIQIFRVDPSTPLHSSSTNIDSFKDDVGIRNAPGVDLLREGSVIWMKKTSDFTLTKTDGMSDTASVVAKGEIPQLSDLPTVAPHNFFMKVLGNADETVDDYYVKFKATNAIFSNGSWEETRLHGIKYKLDESTMPHVLIHHTDGTFQFAKLDGTSLTADGTTYPVLPKWADRLVGDDTSNPWPTFVGKRINDIFYFRNRLGLLADENVILSETNEYFNFFRTTTLDMLDTTPIDVASTHNQVSILTSALAFSKQLILFSNQTQFVLSSGQGALSPETVSITKTTSFDAVTDLKPITLGSSIYFGYSRGTYSGIRQYLRSNATETIFDAEDITSQIPRYIEGSLRNMTGSTHEDIIFLSTDTNRNVIYCYKFYDSLDKGRVQSAWGSFSFSTASEVLGMDFIGSTLYMAIRRTDGIYLEKLRLETGFVDSGFDYRALLDRRVDEEDCTLSADGTTITLPYKVYSSSIEILTDDGDRVPVLTQSDGSADITVESSLTGTDFFIGEAYTLTYEFSDVVLRENTLSNEVALISQGRKQVRYLTLDYHDTAYFRVSVEADIGDRSTSTYPFTGRILGESSLVIGSVSLASGMFKVPVYSKADQVTISIINDSPLPCAITSAEFEMLFHARSRRFS